MEFKMTFENGSEAILHSGIKGMKWGVWNAETAARYGRKGGTKHKTGLSSGQKALILAAGTTVAAVGIATGARLVGTMIAGPAGGVVAGRTAGTATRAFSRAIGDRYDIPSLMELSVSQASIDININRVKKLLKDKI
jgi:hypothetical protein